MALWCYQHRGATLISSYCRTLGLPNAGMALRRAIDSGAIRLALLAAGVLIASLVLGSAITAAVVVIVPKLPGSARVNEEAATPAGNLASDDLQRPRGP